MEKKGGDCIYLKKTFYKVKKIFIINEQGKERRWKTNKRKWTCH